MERRWLLFSVFSFCLLVLQRKVTPSPQIICALIDGGYDCSGHNLQSIPDELPNSAQILDFSFNYLPSIYNSTFARLKSLVYLDLTRCRINWIYEAIFQSQQDLESLILTGNQLMFLSTSSFTGPLALKHLSLAQTSINDLKFIQNNDLNLLETLDLGSNSMNTLDYLNRFIWHNMKTLNFQMNGIQNISATGMSILKNTTGLDLSFKRNDIVYIEPGAFESCRFNSLDLSGSFDRVSLTVILMGLRGLTTNILKLGTFDDAPKVEATADSLRGLCSVSMQEVSFQLLHFPDLSGATFACLAGLKRLNLRRAHLRYLPVNVTNMENLTHLFLDGNSFEDMCDLNVQNFPSLAHLSMRGNREDLNFQESCLKNLSKLEFLDLSHNHLKVGAECCNQQLDGLTSLRHLNLSYNVDMTWGDLPFQKTPQLKLLDCSNLAFLHDPTNNGPFANLPHLEALNLSWASVNLSDTRLLEGLQGLRGLTLTGNSFHLGVVTDAEMFKHVPLLETLIMSACGITAIRDGAFDPLTHLTHADLSNNHLVTVTTSDFYSLKNIRLNFARNEIKIVNVEHVKGLEGNSTIDLSYNPLACNCSNVQFIQWAENNHDKMMRLEDTVCGDPMRGVKISDVHLYCAGMD
ncbi:hypothetical protein AAFF_G00374270 [Aldrovandia affinis]|uniref:Disease resistance R13L4/SHOC-2-like LRR domain-containing protein n=1 Tax=Aldrovandia affinis TaxID=143900 RepID=A0AAD7WLV8_9TELE|nr:hypothetical protein AAFF_G00374270 [Aldrovandia affinis]